MPTLSPLTWIAEQNTKIPADTHVLSYRVQLSAAGAGGTFTIPTSQTNPAQAQFPGIAPTGSPQAGRRLFVTRLCVRDFNGSLGGTGNATVTLQNATQSLAVASAVVPSGTLTQSNVTIAPVTSLNCVINPNDTLAVIHAAGAGTSVGTGFTVDVFGYFQQGI